MSEIEVCDGLGTSGLPSAEKEGTGISLCIDSGIQLVISTSYM